YFPDRSQCKDFSLNSNSCARLYFFFIETRSSFLLDVGRARCGAGDLLGARASRPQMSAKRENSLGQQHQDLRACGAFAGGTPALPANNLSYTGWPLDVVSLYVVSLSVSTLSAGAGFSPSTTLTS